MSDALTALQSVLIGPDDPEIVALEAALRSAQLSADVEALARLISDDLLFTGPDGQRYYMPEQVYKRNKGYGIRTDVLREIKPAGRLDVNRDGRIDVDDIAALGGFIATEGKRSYQAGVRAIHDLNLADKAADTFHGIRQKVIDGIQARGKVRK